MPSFRLSYWMHAGEAPRLLAFEAPDLESAHAVGAKMIAEALGRPKDFALLDREAGRYVVGAAVWSRSGFYRLEVEEAGAPAHAALDEPQDYHA